MGTKLNPGAFDCYAKALPDEPMFVLLARDRAAPLAVLQWIELRRHAYTFVPEGDAAMLEEAHQCAAAMDAWRKANDGKWREPQPPPAEPPQTYDDGITFAIAELAKLIGATDWHIKDGSEDHDQDVRDTILHVLAQGGLYDEDSGKFAHRRATAAEIAEVEARHRAYHGRDDGGSPAESPAVGGVSASSD